MLPWLVAPVLLPAEEATITVNPRVLNINGTDEVPVGLFGVHNLPLTEDIVQDWGIESVRFINQHPDGQNALIGGQYVEKGANGYKKPTALPESLKRVVQCLWDRYQPAFCITRADWKDYLAGLGKAYGEDAKKIGQPQYLEFWNEPYLNWATRPAVNYDGFYYDLSQASVGGPMKVLTTGETIPNLVWDHPVFYALNIQDKKVDYVASSFIPRETKPGETVQLLRGEGPATLEDGKEFTLLHRGTRIACLRWSGKDLTQKYYWSGTVNRQFYIEMFQSFGSSLKEANPEVKLAAGWGLNMFDQSWDCWNLLYRPTIDATHEWLDALYEHHYGGDTRLVAASYEMAYDYVLATYGKRVQLWNTEAGGYIDPEQTGVVKPAAEGDALNRAKGALSYFLRDVIYLVDYCPDKAVMRATHQPQDNGGDEFAFKLLKPLRGKLLETASSSPQVWSVASLEGQRETLAVFNDSNVPATLHLQINPPPGTTFSSLVRREIGPGSRTVNTNGQQTQQPWLAIQETNLPLGQVTPDQVCPPKSALVFVGTLNGLAPELSVQRWDQYASGDVLLNATAEQPAVLKIEMPEQALQGAKGARLRLVLSENPADLQVKINGASLKLCPGAPWIMDFPVDPGLLKTENVLSVSPSDAKPVFVATASIYVQKP
jgi:hypothetical protein